MAPRLVIRFGASDGFMEHYKMPEQAKDSKVWCVPTHVVRDSHVVYVRVPGVAEEIRMALRDLFCEPESGSCVFFEGAVIQRHPYYDAIRVDRPFAAKVRGADRLTLSRADCIRDLWAELELKAQTRGRILVQVTGQNRTHYAITIEGNLSHKCPKGALEEYLRKQLPKEGQRLKYAPREGDTLIAEVVSADAATNSLLLDLVGPLGRLETGDLDPNILGLFGSKTSRVSPTPIDVTSYPGVRSFHFLTIRIEQSPELNRQRNSTRVVVVDDDASFATHLAWLLNEMGYEAEAVSPLGGAEELMTRVHPGDGQTIFLVDANMSPLDGISLIEQLYDSAAACEKDVKCILMSALQPGAPLEARGRITIIEAAERLKGRCVFWRKAQQNLEAALTTLDDLLLHYAERLSAGLDGYASIGSPEPPGPPPAAPDIAPPKDLAEGLQTILDGLKRSAGARWAALFAIGPQDWRVDLLAGELFLNEKCSKLGAQTYLPNSPIRDIGYQESSTLFEADASNDIPRFRNLLRFFENSSLDAPVAHAAFRSVAAIRLGLDTATRYSLFIFHPSPGVFSETAVRPLLQSAAERAELLLLRAIHARQNREHQPFYLEGLARAGLRHDVAAQLTDIQMATAILAKNVSTMGETKLKETLQSIQDIAKSAHDRIERSLDRLRADPAANNTDLRDVVEYAQRIAAGFAVRWRDKKRRVEFDTHCPDEGPFLVHGDANALQRILENLLVNAVEHGLAFFRRKVNILVEIQRQEIGKYAFAILVHDNGPGIHGMDKRRIFDTLFSTKENGYGMGLAVSRAIAEEYGMSLEIQESALLAGTTFVVRVPRQMTSRVARARV